MKQRLAIFASGAGSNAANFIKHFKDHRQIEVAVVYCNKPNAGVIGKAMDGDVPVVIFNKKMLSDGKILTMLTSTNIDYIVLAGFLWLIPSSFLEVYADKIINVHPALLPNYGGKGMYGHQVHQAVIHNKETQSGITIHLVDEFYDHGKNLFQATTEISEGETAESLADKIHVLEQLHFPKVVEEYVLGR